MKISQNIQEEFAPRWVHYVFCWIDMFRVWWWCHHNYPSLWQVIVTWASFWVTQHCYVTGAVLDGKPCLTVEMWYGNSTTVQYIQVSLPKDLEIWRNSYTNITYVYDCGVIGRVMTKRK